MTSLGERPTGALASALAAASGRDDREQPVLPGSGGPAGNAILTAWTGLVLLVLFVSELLTLLDMHGLITWHIAIGALLVPPALVKTGTTTWRMVRYYRGHDAYRQAGPPPILLRLLGPLVVLTTLALLASGVLLVLLGRQSSQHVLVTMPFLRVNWVTVHQITFFVWATVTGLHLVGRLIPALRITVLRQTFSRLPGRLRRLAGAAATLAVAVALALLVAHVAGSWRHDDRPRAHPEGRLAPSDPPGHPTPS